MSTHTPSAWYDAHAHLSAARAVASVLTDYLPSAPGDSPLYRQINHLGDLIGALSACLDACAQQMEGLEQHLGRPECANA